ncbi:MAG: 3-isopropylmalate dehydratase small subunit [Gammaproteobacteria bacterium]|nr:3-isopropylmalate dehydratase small subunit [Gammaproteobacteria bacterium]
MDAFEKLTALVIPLDRMNVDTDAIIPKQYLKAIGRAGFGANLFDNWRYLDAGDGRTDAERRPNPDFVLNKPRYRGAQILLARANFGCGSSREHAPWALLEYGIRAIIAPSFADIFFNNSLKNGLLPVIVPDAVVDRLFRDVEANPGYALTVDLVSETVVLPDGTRVPFQIDPFRRECLLRGLDDVGWTLQYEAQIKQYEERRRAEAPWLFVAE